MAKPVMKFLFCGMLPWFACEAFARQIDTSLLIGTYPETDFSYKVRADCEVKMKFGTFCCLTITESSPITDFVGEFWCDESVDLTAETFTFKSLDGELTTLYRIPGRVLTKINATKVDRVFLHHNFSVSHGIGILYILCLAHNKSRE